MALTTDPDVELVLLTRLIATGPDPLDRTPPVVRGTLLGQGLIRWSTFDQRYHVTDNGRAELVRRVGAR